MTIIKNKYSITALILISGLIIALGLMDIALSGGDSGDGPGSSTGVPGIPGAMMCSVTGMPSNSGSTSNGNGTGDGGGGGWDFSPPPPPAPTVTLTTWPIFELPEPIHLYWSSTNADSCVASGDWSGNKPTSGNEYLSKPRGTYIFTLTCTGPGGSASDSVTVKVIQVPQCTFTANPTTIIPPAFSTLSWNCLYADACSIDQGIGSVSNVSGTKGVRPTKTTTYTLTCSGLDDERYYYATVNVGFTPRLREVIPR